MLPYSLEQYKTNEAPPTYLPDFLQVRVHPVVLITGHLGNREFDAVTGTHTVCVCVCVCVCGGGGGGGGVIYAQGVKDLSLAKQTHKHCDCVQHHFRVMLRIWPSQHKPFTTSITSMCRVHILHVRLLPITSELLSPLQRSLSTHCVYCQ